MIYRVKGKFATKDEYDRHQSGAAPQTSNVAVATRPAPPSVPTPVKTPSPSHGNVQHGRNTSGMHKAQRLINHVALVLDGSGSMSSHKNNVIKVADEQIRHLMLRSEELCQETRVSVYWFDDKVKCLIFDISNQK